MTKVMKCECQHQFQDMRYGLQNRVHNQMKGNTTGGWRCTVCSKTKTTGGK